MIFHYDPIFQLHITFSPYRMNSYIQLLVTNYITMNLNKSSDIPAYVNLGSITKCYGYLLYTSKTFAIIPKYNTIFEWFLALEIFWNQIMELTGWHDMISVNSTCLARILENDLVIKENNPSTSIYFHCNVVLPSPTYHSTALLILKSGHSPVENSVVQAVKQRKALLNLLYSFLEAINKEQFKNVAVSVFITIASASYPCPGKLDLCYRYFLYFFYLKPYRGTMETAQSLLYLVLVLLSFPKLAFGMTFLS